VLVEGRPASARPSSPGPSPKRRPRADSVAVYEGLDEAKALYEWEYAKQLLYTQLLKDKIATDGRAQTIETPRAGRFIGRRLLFQALLVAQAVLQALLNERPALLLIDEIDKADPEFEAFLLEVLADFAVTIPELGTLKAVHTPRVSLTSNNARELSDALKRRCLHCSSTTRPRNASCASFAAGAEGLREALGQRGGSGRQAAQMDLKKSPSIAETITGAGAGVAERRVVVGRARRADAEPRAQARERRREGEGAALCQLAGT